MSTAQRIGLLPDFGWVADHGWLATTFICLAITPGMMFVLGMIGESRLLPVRPSKQFMSFMPGDFLLAVTIVMLLMTA